MDAPFILHMLSPLKTVSPFDVNMAADAGYQVIVPYAGVTLDETAGLTQDAIFSRPPQTARRTALFIGGRDAVLALDMLQAAREAMVAPFAISVMADPSGAFTTAAAMVAVVEKHLRQDHATTLEGRSVQVYGASGVVGGIVAVLAAQAGARVTMVSHRGIAAVSSKAMDFKRRFAIDLLTADGSNDAVKHALVADAEIVLACAKAGVQVLSAANLAHARRLLVAADINAVPPAGIEGVAVTADGVPIDGAPALGIGALAVGTVKVHVQHVMLQAMRDATEPLYLDFQDAYRIAREKTG